MIGSMWVGKALFVSKGTLKANLVVSSSSDILHPRSFILSPQEVFSVDAKENVVSDFSVSPVSSQNFSAFQGPLQSSQACTQCKGVLLLCRFVFTIVYLKEVLFCLFTYFISFLLYRWIAVPARGPTRPETITFLVNSQTALGVG